MPKTRSDYIREELERDFNASAVDIAERVKKKGHPCEAQNVYQMRSTMRMRQRQQVRAIVVASRTRTRDENAKPLGQHILNILTAHPEGLSDRDLASAIKKAGYSSRASDFLMIVRQKLYNMVETGHITKNGLQYKLQGVALEKAQKQVAQVAAEASDYALLREAIVDFARTKGFDNPDTFPDILISQRRQFTQVQKQYLTLFEAGSNNGILQ
jgi:hypothetical protein